MIENGRNYVLLAHLTSVFLISLDLEVLNQFQPYIFHLTSLKLSQWQSSTANEFRSLNPFVVINSYSQVLGRYILHSKLEVLVPDWICLVVLKNINYKLETIIIDRPRFLQLFWWFLSCRVVGV